MMKRRLALKGLLGMTAMGVVPRLASAAPAKARVTLVRWPYT